MDLLFSYTQQKNDRNRRKEDSVSECRLKLFKINDKINYEGIFEFKYNRYGSPKLVIFEHKLEINLSNGDIKVTYSIDNNLDIDEKFFRSLKKEKNNDFKSLYDLVENGLIRGEKRRNYWGVKYDRAIEKFTEIIANHIKENFKSEFFKSKDYTIKPFYGTIYDILVDFHLDCKGIKGHDSVYFDIQNDYPKKKWLIQNDNKFLPAVLDYYGIKSKYLIKELNVRKKDIHISSLNYFCKLFGTNYVDYLKKFAWEEHCFDAPVNKKIHLLKNESEKEQLINVINTWELNTIKTDSLIYNLNKLLSIREFLEEKGMEDLKFKAKNDLDFDNLFETWTGHKLHFSRGYKVRYVVPDDFIQEVEQDIEINGSIYKPKLILTEDDFRVEGYNMKNCMSKQFVHGLLYTFVALQNKRTRINLQYRKGALVQAYGKANTQVKNIFDEAINILTKRFKKYSDLSWTKEKYDFISN